MSSSACGGSVGTSEAGTGRIVSVGRESWRRDPDGWRQVDDAAGGSALPDGFFAAYVRVLLQHRDQLAGGCL